MPAFNTTLQLDEPADSVDARLATALSRMPKNYVVNVRPGLIVLSRRYTPGWAITLAILGLLLFLLGLLFLLVKKTDTLTISVSSRAEGGCTVVVAGEAEDWVINHIQSTLTAAPPRAAAMTEGRMVDPHSTGVEIERLAGLHERGVLTDEEFQATKARLLGL